MDLILQKNEKNQILCKSHNLPCLKICLVENCKYFLNCKNCKKIHEKHHSVELNISLKQLLDKEYPEKILERSFLEEEKKIKNDLNIVRKDLLYNLDNLENSLIEKLRSEIFNKESIDTTFHYMECLKKIENKSNDLFVLKNISETYKSLQDILKKKKEYSFENAIIKFANEMKFFFLNSNITYTPINKEKYEFGEELFDEDEGIFENSEILDSDEKIEFIKKDLFENKLTKTKLIFRGSEDGFKASSFHSKCDNKGPTLVVIKSKLGKIFGGFNSYNWTAKRGDGTYLKTEGSFLFSYDHKKKINCKDPEKSIYYDSGALCIFGKYNFPFAKSWDLAILENCDVDDHSYSNLGSAYETPNNLEYRSKETQEFLAGAFNFVVDNIEVYCVR